MSKILRNLGEALFGLPPEYVPNPKGSIAITAQEMYDRAEAAGNPWYWRDHRLIQVADQRLPQDGGAWPNVASVGLLEDGEGGEPTVYLADPRTDGAFPLHPSDYVILLPPL